MQNYIRNILYCLLISCLFISGCSRTRPPAEVDVQTLDGLRSMSTSYRVSSRQNYGVNKIREMALKETALGLGAQAGLAKRAEEINDQLVEEARSLDTIFDFNALILEHNVLPPVLLEGRKVLNLADAQTIRISDRNYKISKQARFVTTPPNWRQYLWMDYKSPELPNVDLLPKTSTEKEIWRRAVTKGWMNGAEQANNILEDNIARIKEDFAGMLLYRKLLAMNMVSPPFVSNTELGVTGDASEIHIDDKVLRITALPALNTDSTSWRAAVTKEPRLIEEFNAMEALVKNARITVTQPSWQPTIQPISERKP